MAKKKRPVGRPSKYKPDFHPKSIINYFRIEPWTAKDMTITKSDGTTIDKTEREANNIVFFEDWCDSVGISDDAMVSWTKKYPEFKAAYKRARTLQENMIVVNALQGLYTNAFSIFYLKNKYGYRDEQFLKGEGIASQTVYITNYGTDKKQVLPAPRAESHPQITSAVQGS